MNAPIIGLLTFHAAHNYGSVLQAYATQSVLDSLGLSNEIVNYRLPNQLVYYNTFYSPRFGTKTFLHRLACLPEIRLRNRRRREFERFIGDNLRLSSRCFHSIGQLRNEAAPYSVLLVGSDQVWNRHCAAEFATEPPESVLAYLLAFGPPDAKRIAFSSSVGSMRLDELREFTPQLKAFHAISMRESSAADMVSEIIGHPVATTLDPTLMLDRESWKPLCQPTPLTDGDYVLVYSLKKLPQFLPLLRSVRAYARKRGLGVVSIAPFSPLLAPGVRNAISAGPREFLSLVSHAKLVLTDSFHGTAFSVNFGVPFYVLGGTGDRRKHLLLERLGLAHRILPNLKAISTAPDGPCDFPTAHATLARERLDSLDYLRCALPEHLRDHCKEY